MIPLKDDVPSRTTPFITLLIIGLNVAVSLYQFSLQIGSEPGALRAAHDFALEFGAVPCRLTGECGVPNDVPPPVLTIFTSMFLHGGLLHLGGNMLYLWIFGDNVEDALGHARFLVFYLSSGVAAAGAQTLMNPASGVPVVGASGAISGVLGAYLVLFPYARVLTLVTFGIFWRLIYLPAVIVLGLWFLLQFLFGALSLVATGAGGEGGGVAWFAHVGGFLAGTALLFVLKPRGGARL